MAKSEQRRQAFVAAYDAMLARWTMAPAARDVTTADGTTHVQVWGRADAPPLVMMHGFKVSSTMWAPNAAAFGAVRRVYAPDTLGDYGLSTSPKPPRSLDELLGWLTRLLDALELPAVDIGGMSYGGWLAAHFAARHPERVRKLVLLAPGATFGSFSGAWYLRGMPMILWHRRAFAESYLRWAGVAPTDPAARSAYDALLGGIVDVMHEGHRTFPIFGLPVPAPLPEEVARKIVAPTLLVYGEQEKMYPAAAAIEVARARIANLTSVLIPAASHDLTFGQPARVNQAVSEFLTS